MDRFFVAFATVLASGIFAYAYLKEWANHVLWKKPLILKASEEIDYPYFHQSESLYLRVFLIFGLLFAGLFISSIALFCLKKWNKLFLVFVLTMLCILALMINGAIK